MVSCKLEKRFLNESGSDIYYYTSGTNNSEAIVFLHPAFSDHRSFNPQVDFFSNKYRVITIDLIGHGLSKANKSKEKIDASSKHIERILEIEGYNKVHIVGVSMGSLIAQHFALNHPDKILSLTALGGYNINKESTEVTKAQNSSNIGLVLRAIFSMNSFRKKIAEISCYSKNGQTLFYETASLYKRKSFMVMQGLQNMIKDRDNIGPTYPTLILTGEFDIDLAKKMAKEWNSEIDNSKYFMIKDAGHCANIDNPNEFNRIVIEFISSSN